MEGGSERGGRVGWSGGWGYEEMESRVSVGLESVSEPCWFEGGPRLVLRAFRAPRRRSFDSGSVPTVITAGSRL